MAGLSTYFGHAISEHADRHLDLVGIGRLLALSSQAELNALASIRYRSEFGRNSVYTLPTTPSKNRKHELSQQHRGYTLFNESATYSKLASLLSQNATIRTTQLSDDFTYQDFLAKHGNRAIPMFALTPKKKYLEIFVAGGKLMPAAGWSLISLIPADVEPAVES